MKLISIVIFAVMLSACATSNYEHGRNFTADQVEQIKEGKTTKEQVISRFGSPSTVSKSSNGIEIWLYQYTKTTSHAQSLVFAMNVKTSSESKMLRVTFKDNLVQSYSYTQSPAM